MTNDDLEIYLRLLVEDLIARGKKKALLVLDSWGSFKNKNIFEKIQGEYEGRIFLDKEIIPAGCTKYCQPFDVFYFRPYKEFLRKITDSLEMSEKIWQRDNIFKLQAVAHYQFSAPQFRNMIRYAWFKSGYLKERPPRFKQAPKKVCSLVL